MRKVVYGVACSLDGYVARADGAVDWLLFTEDAKQLMAESWSRFDTFLMGRKTWEAAGAGAGGGGGGGGGGPSTFVFSRSLPSLPGKGATLVRDGAGEFVAKLKQQPGKDICLMGGGDFARSLLQAGVVDEIGMNVHPVLLGGGIPMFPELRTRVSLERTECRPLAAGCVLLTFRVVANATASKRKRSR